MFGLTTNCPHY